MVTKYLQSSLAKMIILPHRHGLKRSLMGAILWLLSLPGGGLGQTYIPDPTENNPITTDDSATQAPLSCPDQEKCNIAGAVIGSLIGGFILGAVVGYFARPYLRRKKQWVPPKDYDVSDGSHVDVNRNNDGSIQCSVQPFIAPDPPEVKGHKKLERLVKPSHTSPGDIEIPPAAVPLIQNNGAAVEAGESTTSASRSNNTDPPGTGKDNMYANIGASSILSQPYEVLGSIPEETEYENSRDGSYEGILLEPAAK